MFIRHTVYFINAFFSESLIHLIYSENMLSICTCVAYAEVSSEIEIIYT